MNKFIINSGIIGLLLISLTAGCIKEDRTQCNSSLSISFRYVVGSEGENLFSKNIKAISLLLFDANGIYVQTYNESVSDLAYNDYIMHIPNVPNGKYSILTLGDTDSEHYIIGAESKTATKTKTLIPKMTHISDFRVKVIHDDNVVTRKLGNFFISKPQNVLVDGIGHKTILVNLIKNTKTIHITINGLDHLIGFIPVVNSTNGTYNAENNIPDNTEVVKYKPHTTTRAGNYSQTSTLRIISDHKIPINIEDSDGNSINVGKNHDLISLIKKNPNYQSQQDLDNEDGFDIALNYVDNVLISVTVNDWKHVFVTPET